MKKFLFLLGIAFIFASCNKCQDCSYEGLQTEEVCQDDFDSKDDYNDAIDILESAGWECK